MSTALSLALTLVGVYVVAIGVMVAALQVADLLARTLRRKAGRS